MSFTHDLIHSLDEPKIRRRSNSKRIQSPQLVAPAVDGRYEPEDFDDEQITGLTAEQTKDELRRVKQYGKNP